MPDTTPASPDARFDAVDRRIAGAIDAGVASAAVLVVRVHGRTLHERAWGCLAPGGAAADVETVFDLASLTKPVVAAAMLRLHDAGRFDLEAPVGSALPGFAQAAFAHATMRQIATHTAGLPAWAPLTASGPGRDACAAALLTTPLESEPGSAYRYSDLGYILLGMCLEHAAGEPLHATVRRLVTGPLGMCDTGYLPGHDRNARIAATGSCPGRPGRTLIGEVHDANAHGMGGVAGHAGLFGTARDMARLADAIHGLPRTPAFLPDRLLRAARQSQIPPEIGGQGFGWFTPPNPLAPIRGLPGPRVFGHSGFTGTLIACDADLGLTVALLTNRVLMPGDNRAIVGLRSAVLVDVRTALGAP